MITYDLLIILKVYLVSLVLQLICWPTTMRLFEKLNDKGWPMSRLITTLGASLFVWQLANLGVSINTNTGFVVTLSGILVANYWWLLTRGEAPRITKETIKMIVMEEYLFLVGLFGITLIRAFLPNIDSLEKFMDYGFIKTYLLSSSLPAIDMWQAGEAINYYSFGHFWASGLIRFFMVDSAVGYNLVLGFIAGLSMSMAFSISYYLTGAKKGIAAMLGGLTGAMATILAGNTHVIWYFITNKGLSGYWYADATRFIEGTIHEFPGYSFVVADLHGHVLGIPMVLLFLAVCILWTKQRTVGYEAILGILFGIMMMTNTWDVAVYGLLLVVVGIQLVIKDTKNFLGLIKSAGIMGLFMGLTALPWLLSFESISSGIRVVSERSPMWQLAALWTGGLLITVMVTWIEGRKERSLMIRTLAITLILLIIIPELVYAKDIYPDHPRANTMFKLTFQASIMIGLLSGALWGKLLDGERKMKAPVRWVGIIIAGVIFCGTLIFPAEAFPNFYNNFKTYQGLNGEQWMKNSMPEKYKVIKYLQKYADGRNMVEAVGDSYTEFNAVSVFSGVPTIQGWRVHEWLWRGGYDEVAIREGEVKDIYETGDQAKRKLLIDKYNVGWILVSKDEVAKYVVNNPALKEMGDIVFEEGETYLIRVRVE